MRRGWLRPKEIRLQHVSELTKADVYMSQFRWQIVPDPGSGNRRVSVAKTVLWDNACSVVGWSKETTSAVSKKLDIIGQVLGGRGADHVVTCTWYRPVWTALVDRLEANATGVALAWCVLVVSFLWWAVLVFCWFGDSQDPACKNNSSTNSKGSGLRDLIQLGVMWKKWE